jgi:hypothetical protein
MRSARSLNQSPLVSTCLPWNEQIASFATEFKPRPLVAHKKKEDKEKLEKNEERNRKGDESKESEEAGGAFTYQIMPPPRIISLGDTFPIAIGIETIETIETIERSVISDEIRDCASRPSCS